jgi:hypothetical protein
MRFREWKISSSARGFSWREDYISRFPLTPRRSTFVGPLPNRRGGRLLRGFDRGEMDGERRACAEFAFDFDAAVMLFDDFL